MMIFNKLVRDRIPEKIEGNGEKAVVRTLNDDAYKLELNKKLLEECNEVIGAKDSTEIKEELGDVLEVIRAMAELNNSNLDEIIRVSDAKREKRGGFDKRIFLERTYEIDECEEQETLLN